jgi:TalC/MipB family fructose-6-phosphate aldolase
MEIWLDTIDEDVIADGVKTGVIAGVTTNPSILSHAHNVLETLTRLLDIQSGPVAVQVTSTDPIAIVDEGMRIFELSSRLIVKVPINRNGLIAIKQLQGQKIPVMGTGVLFPSQALLASNLGVAYIAPYFSHMGDIGDASAALKTMVDILHANGSTTKILAASVKQVDHIISLATLGVAAVTIKPDLYYKLLADHPLVEGFAQRFLLDWTQTHGKLSIKEALLRN